MNGYSSPDHRGVSLDELFIHRFFTRNTVGILIERIKEHPEAIVGLVPRLYRVRQHWWDSDCYQAAIDAAISKYFRSVHGKDSSDLPNERGVLSFWADMSTCFAHNGNKAIVKSCEKALLDKRRIQEFKNLPNLPAAPTPSRVADYAFVCLMVVHEVDVERVFEEYGLKELDLVGYQKQSDEMFDKAIADYERIKERYYPKK